MMEEIITTPHRMRTNIQGELVLVTVGHIWEKSLLKKNGS